jgi:hypothetical protein
LRCVVTNEGLRDDAGFFVRSRDRKYFDEARAE